VVVNRHDISENEALPILSKVRMRREVRALSHARTHARASTDGEREVVGMLAEDQIRFLRMSTFYVKFGKIKNYRTYFNFKNNF